jgi:hypothetical protein
LCFYVVDVVTVCIIAADIVALAIVDVVDDAEFVSADVVVLPLSMQPLLLSLLSLFLLL